MLIQVQFPLNFLYFSQKVFLVEALKVKHLQIYKSRDLSILVNFVDSLISESEVKLSTPNTSLSVPYSVFISLSNKSKSPSPEAKITLSTILAYLSISIVILLELFANI